MSEIKVDTLTGKTSAGDITVTSEGGAATMQLQQGLAKAWVNFNGTGTIAIRDSLSVSGLVDNGTGDYTVTISNAFSAVNYAIFGTAGAGATHAAVVMSPYAISTQTTSAMRSRNFGSASALQDQDLQSTSLMGDLA